MRFKKIRDTDTEKAYVKLWDQKAEIEIWHYSKEVYLRFNDDVRPHTFVMSRKQFEQVVKFVRGRARS